MIGNAILVFCIRCVQNLLYYVYNLMLYSRGLSFFSIIQIWFMNLPCLQIHHQILLINSCLQIHLQPISKFDGNRNQGLFVCVFIYIHTHLFIYICMPYDPNHCVQLSNLLAISTCDLPYQLFSMDCCYLCFYELLHYTNIPVLQKLFDFEQSKFIILYKSSPKNYYLSLTTTESSGSHIVIAYLVIRRE